VDARAPLFGALAFALALWSGGGGGGGGGGHGGECRLEPSHRAERARDRAPGRVHYAAAEEGASAGAAGARGSEALSVANSAVNQLRCAFACCGWLSPVCLEV